MKIEEPAPSAGRTDVLSLAVDSEPFGSVILVKWWKSLNFNDEDGVLIRTKLLGSSPGEVE